MYNMNICIYIYKYRTTTSTSDTFQSQGVPKCFACFNLHDHPSSLYQSTLRQQFSISNLRSLWISDLVSHWNTCSHVDHTLTVLLCPFQYSKGNHQSLEAGIGRSTNIYKLDCLRFNVRRRRLRSSCFNLSFNMVDHKRHASTINIYSGPIPFSASYNRLSDILYIMDIKFCCITSSFT